MGIFARIFGSGKKQPQEKPPARSAAATQSTPGTDRLTYEKAADFSAILQYCSAKEKEGKDWPSPNLLRQLSEVLRDAPIRNASRASVSLTRKLPAIWKGRQDLMVTENLQFTRSLTGDFAAVVDEIMDKIGRAEKIGVFVSLNREPELGVTVNGHVVEGVFSLLTVKLPSSRFALYSCLQQAGSDPAARRALDRFSELLSMSRTDFQKHLDADFECIKANMVQLARGGKTMEFLAESSRKRADEISETAAEVLVSEPAFAETLAKQLASTYTFVKEAGKAAGSRYAANDPLRKMAEKMGAEDLFADTLGEVRAKNAGPVMDMGRAAHLLMRAMRRDPKLGNRTAILDSLRQLEHAGDPFVSGNAVEALKIFRQANQPPQPPTPQQLGQPKPSGVVPGRRSPGGGYLCPYCGKGTYEPYPDSGSPNRRCNECATVFSTTSLASD
jgi:hypothetical protein